MRTRLVERAREGDEIALWELVPTADRPTAREGGRAPQFSKLEGHAAVVFSWTSSTGGASAFAGPSSISTTRIRRSPSGSPRGEAGGSAARS